MTGFPTFSKQYAGIKISCDLTLTVGSADWMTMEVKFYKTIYVVFLSKLNSNQLVENSPCRLNQPITKLLTVDEECKSVLIE